MEEVRLNMSTAVVEAPQKLLLLKPIVSPQDPPPPPALFLIIVPGWGSFKHYSLTLKIKIFFENYRLWSILNQGNPPRAFFANLTNEHMI